MARFRLRFLLQEFDLVGPEVLIGRSADCQITIEDPLVSRQHARLRIDNSTVRVDDLGSRNGVRVNGKRVSEPTTLRHGDRVRLGTQELVFLSVNQPQETSRTTGFMSTCDSCGTPYPEQAGRCPHCGAEPAQDDVTTLSGLSVEPRHDWTVQLLGQVIDRAIATGRGIEADRLMRRVAGEIEDRISAEQFPPSTELSQLTRFALDLARLRRDGDWIRWIFAVHRRAGCVPSTETIVRLGDAATDLREELREDVAAFAEWARARQDPAVEGRLEELERLFG